jgi:hypothetical protein
MHLGILMFVAAMQIDQRFASFKNTCRAETSSDLEGEAFSRKRAICGGLPRANLCTGRRTGWYAYGGWQQEAFWGCLEKIWDQLHFGGYILDLGPATFSYAHNVTRLIC